jgi:hypothetical protein
MSEIQKTNDFFSQGISIAERAAEQTSQLTEVSSMLLEQMKQLKEGKTDVVTCQAMGDLAKQIIDIHRTNIAAAALVIKTIHS